MERLTAEDVRKVARLANLRIADEEVEKMATHLTDILKHIEMLSRLDTSGVPATSHALKVENVFRNDGVASPFAGIDPLENAPARDKNYFSVPRVIE